MPNWPVRKFPKQSWPLQKFVHFWLKFESLTTRCVCECVCVPSARVQENFFSVPLSCGRARACAGQSFCSSWKMFVDSKLIFSFGSFLLRVHTLNLNGLFDTFYYYYAAATVETTEYQLQRTLQAHACMLAYQDKLLQRNSWASDMKSKLGKIVYKYEGYERDYYFKWEKFLFHSVGNAHSIDC